MFFCAILTSKLSINYKKSRFMYNEKLEELIDAALADGVLTEKKSKFFSRKLRKVVATVATLGSLVFLIKMRSKYIVYQIVSFI